MKKTLLFFWLIIVSGTLYAQVPMVESPVHLDLGIGGGISMPVGTLGNGDNTGFHAGAKARLHGFMPMNLLGNISYNRLPNKVGGESDVVWMASAGLEYPIPSIMVQPYFGADVAYNSISNTVAGFQSRSRFGAGFGAGVAFSVPSFGNIDASVKYQLLNLIGKDPNEDTVSQIAANISLMFSIL